ncbi:branched-chain-amino-acid aminotransferase [Paenibacillus sp. NAIST15-1]|nr:branched-chain-amino-acid aminotransferase [Paenibacillus sp. NAIST15-1]
MDVTLVESFTGGAAEVEYLFPAVVSKSGAAVLLHLTQVRIETGREFVRETDFGNSNSRVESFAADSRYEG